MASLIESIFRRIEHAKVVTPEYLRIMLGDNTTPEMVKQIEESVKVISERRPQVEVKMYFENRGPSEIIREWPFIGYIGYGLEEVNKAYGKLWVENAFKTRPIKEFRVFGIDQVMEVLRRLQK